MATSEASICSSALVKIGAARINALTDNTVEGKLCAQQYEKVRDDLLRSHPWNFATVRAALVNTSNTPVFEFDNEYQLPTDCLRVLKMEYDESYAWRVEGDKLLTDSITANIKYIKRVTNVNLFSVDFAETLAAKLAYDFSYTLVESVQFREMLKKDYEDRLRSARTFNGQEGAGTRVYADSWLNSRY